MTSNFIVDVSETDFEYEVLAYSQNTPVVVDFWAPWCQPCKTLTPLLEGMANEAVGAFRLARVNVDDNPNLAMRYGVRSIPTVKAFSQGQAVAEFIGLQPERVNEFLTRLLPPSRTALAIESHQPAGRSPVALRRNLFHETDDEDPETGIQLGLVKAILAQGNGAEAAVLLQLPGQPRIPLRWLRPVKDWSGSTRTSFPMRPTWMPTSAAARLARRGNLEAAMDSARPVATASTAAGRPPGDAQL
jgi:putative thioredoxin